MCVCVCVCVQQPRQTVLTAAGSIGQASGDLLRQIGENETDERFQVIRLSVTTRTTCCARFSVRPKLCGSAFPMCGLLF